jgi:hypothetical protein
LSVIDVVDGPHCHRRKHRTIAATTIIVVGLACGLTAWSIATETMLLHHFVVVMTLLAVGGLYLTVWISLEQRITRRPLSEYRGTIIDRYAPYDDVAVSGLSHRMQNIVMGGDGIVVIAMRDGSTAMLAITGQMFRAFAQRSDFTPLWTPGQPQGYQASFREPWSQHHGGTFGYR